MGLCEPTLQASPVRRLHHVGFVVSSIEVAADRFAKSLGATWNHEVIYDPLQVAKVSFINGVQPLCAAIELVEPAGTNSPVERFEQKGGGLHHLCYEVGELEDQLKLSRSLGGVIVRPPLPAVAFNGRRIAWVFTKDKLLLEFLEAGTGEG